jgi:glutaconate CoA-transferase subunit A
MWDIYYFLWGYAMEKFMETDKLLTAKEAIGRFVNDGDSFVFANCLYAMPLALSQELIRQKKRNLMCFQQGGIEEIDQLLEGDVIDRLVLAYNFRAGGKRLNTPLDRAIKEGRVVVEEMTNHTLLSMMKAGAMGYPFMPVMGGIRVTDVVKRRGFLGDQRFAEVEDPFTKRKTLLVKGYNPDFALMHVQRADRMGNGQLWGAMINSKWAALAAQKVILTTEKIVDTEVIKTAPHLTIVPAHKVCAVVECPWGAHPSEVAGYYDYDMPFRALFVGTSQSPEGFKAWLDEWIFGVADRKEYIEHYVEKFGEDTLDGLRAKPFLSEPADYGFPFTRVWDDNDYSQTLGMSMEEFVAMLSEKGVLIDGD